MNFWKLIEKKYKSQNNKNILKVASYLKFFLLFIPFHTFCYIEIYLSTLYIYIVLLHIYFIFILLKYWKRLRGPAQMPTQLWRHLPGSLCGWLLFKFLYHVTFCGTDSLSLELVNLQNSTSQKWCKLSNWVYFKKI